MRPTHSRCSVNGNSYDYVIIPKVGAGGLELGLQVSLGPLVDGAKERYSTGALCEQSGKREISRCLGEMVETC